MNKKLKIALFLYAAFDIFFGGVCGGLLPLSQLLAAQTILKTTTLSAAVTTGDQRVISLTSASGVSAPNPANPSSYTFLYVDRELLDVEAVNGTQITVIRGAESTQGTPHASSAVVFVIPANLALYVGGGSQGQGPAVPAGSCTRSTELVLPRIQFASGIISDCDGGQWVNADALQTTRPWVHGKTSGVNGFRYPDPGGTALTALETSGTAAAASTEIYCTEVDPPISMYVQGIAVLNGTTVGTNKHFAILYDQAGAVLANTATAGTTTAGASTYQKMNFVTPYFLVAPARYFACDGLNGTTDTIRHAVTGTNDNVLGGTITGQTFGTAAAITVPSSFTTAKVPYFMLF